MSRFVADASIGIRLFLEEEGSEAVATLFAPEALPLVPDLFHIECANVLWKRVTRDGYPRRMAEEHVADLVALALPTTPTAELLGRALELVCDYRITAYDACYAALAERHGVPLVTADRALQQALAEAPVEVVTVEEYLRG